VTQNHDRDREFYRREIEAILERPLDYFPDLRPYRLGRVTWIGRPGYSASVEAWIRHVWELLKDQETFKASEHWFVRCHSAARPESQHNHLYFAFHHGSPLEGELIACGGATDYSGAGGHARELAEAFMALVSELSHGVVEVKDHEIGYLIEHLLEE
jgi:hypothetical protein